MHAGGSGIVTHRVHQIFPAYMAAEGVQSPLYGDVAHLVERDAGSVEVAGSIPAVSTIFRGGLTGKASGC